MKLDDIKKFAILKNGIGIEGQKICKHVRDQRNSAQVLLEIEKNPKAFAIPILTGYLADMVTVRKGIANALGFFKPGMRRPQAGACLVS